MFHEDVLGMYLVLIEFLALNQEKHSFYYTKPYPSTSHQVVQDAHIPR